MATPSPSNAATKTPGCFGAARDCAADRSWPKHRILFLLAGTFTLTGTVLAASVNRWFALLPGLVGVNQLLLVATGWCPASALFDRVSPSTRRAMPNGRPQHSGS